MSSSGRKRFSSKRGHWYLLILCNFNHEIIKKSQCTIQLDSLHGVDNPIQPLIRNFVFDLLKSELKQVDKALVSGIPILIPKVPQQNNGEDCGAFVLYYAYKFMESAPKNFNH